MGCRCTKKGDIRYASLTFLREELLYDIRNAAYAEGEVMDETAEHSRHTVFDVGEDGNVDRVTRILDMSHRECVEALFPYTKKEVPKSPPDPLGDVLEETETYEINLTLPGMFSLTTVELLEKFVHEYMVDRALEDWLSIANPPASAKWKEKADVLRGRMRSALVSRGRAARRALKPF